jgi:hypothetical protein
MSDLIRLSSTRTKRLARLAAIALACGAASGTNAAPVAASASPASATITTTIHTTPAPAPVNAPASAPDVEIQPFPNAIPVGNYESAREQGSLPISPPDQSATSRDRISQYVAPYDGRVRALQYRHAPDESPLLVLRHYTSQLRAQGFTLVDVCDAPCRTPSGLEDENAFWDRELDPSRRLDQRAFGDRGAYVIAYRHDALVAVRVGLWDLDVTSTVKIIQSDAIDHSAIERYVQVQRAAAMMSAASAPAAADRAASTPVTKSRRK